MWIWGWQYVPWRGIWPFAFPSSLSFFSHYLSCKHVFSCVWCVTVEERGKEKEDTLSCMCVVCTAHTECCLFLLFLLIQKSLKNRASFLVMFFELFFLVLEHSWNDYVTCCHAMFCCGVVHVSPVCSVHSLIVLNIHWSFNQSFRNPSIPSILGVVRPSLHFTPRLAQSLSPLTESFVLAFSAIRYYTVHFDT